MDLSNFSKEYSSLISKLEEARKSLNTFTKETEECLKSLLPPLFSPKEGEKDLVSLYLTKSTDTVLKFQYGLFGSDKHLKNCFYFSYNVITKELKQLDHID